MKFSEASHLSSLQLHDNTVAVYIPQNSTELGDESALFTSQFGSISLISLGPNMRKSLTPFWFPLSRRPSNLGISSFSTATIS